MKSFSPLTIRVEDNQLNIGDKLKFDNGTWRDSVGAVLQSDRQYIVLGTMTKLVRWMESGPPNVIAANPGEDLPKVDDLNAAIPQEEWSLDLNGRPRPPWARWHIVVLLDANQAQLFSFGNSTVGMVIAFHELRERIELMCALQGAEVLAVVQLNSVLMKTQFGDRQRPRFLITGWRQFRNGALRLVDQSTSALEEVKPVPLGVEMKDEVPY